MTDKLGFIIKRARQDKGVGQKELSKMLNKTPSTLSQVETGQLIPGEELLQIICNYLDLDYGLLGRMAQYEKARSELQKLAAKESLGHYEQVKTKKQNQGGGEGGKFKFTKIVPMDQIINDSTDSIKGENSSYMVIPNLNAKNQKKLDWLAFRKDWLAKQGGENDKKIILAASQEMAPLIEKGDFVLVDSSPMGLQIRPGNIYAINSGQGIMLRRVYYGETSKTLILAADNRKDFPDEELINNFPSNPFIIGRVFWISREL